MSNNMSSNMSKASLDVEALLESASKEVEAKSAAQSDKDRKGDKGDRKSIDRYSDRGRRDRSSERDGRSRDLDGDEEMKDSSDKASANGSLRTTAAPRQTVVNADRSTQMTPSALLEETSTAAEAVPVPALARQSHAENATLGTIARLVATHVAIVITTVAVLVSAVASVTASVSVSVIVIAAIATATATASVTGAEAATRQRLTRRQSPQRTSATAALSLCSSCLCVAEPKK
ncbi:hypothetical protein LTR28_011417 [Elasticomyces elasticus]|nr:hypothetical protein LTR28_011417 [Elasticomyces elasticus]